MLKKQKKEGINIVMLCIYIGLLATLVMIGIFLLTKYVL